MAKHFYFKFGPGNSFFKSCFPIEEVGKQADLPIFFNNNEWSWRLEEFQKSGVPFEADRFYAEATKRKFHSIEIEQIKTFIQLSQEPSGENYIWTFYNQQVFVFKMVGSAQDDTSTRFGEKQYAKTVLATCCRIFDLIDLPYFFASLHANQRYNRRTISQFIDSEHRYADFLMPDKLVSDQMMVKKNERLSFFSPVQFETLIFLIFHHAGIFCSTCRGGTVKDFDLKIIVFPESDLTQVFQVGSHFIQIKMKNTEKLSALKNGWNIWLGDSDVKNKVLGNDWLEEQLVRFPKVNEWLEHSLAFLLW